MAALNEQRRRFTAALVVMGIMCILAGLYLVDPVGASGAKREQELLDKQKTLRDKEEQTRPIRNLPQLVEKAKTDVNKFSSDRLAAYPSTVYSSIYDLAKKNNVSLGEMKYEVIPEPPPPLQLLQVTATVSGGYSNLVRFINALERDKIFFVIRDLQLSDTKGQSSNSIQLRLGMETYLRERKPNEKPGTPSKKTTDDEEDDSE
jgi:type IV pilus assembly protein PilO